MADGPATKGRRLTASALLVGVAVALSVGTLALWFLGELFPDAAPEVGRVVFGNVPEAVIVLFYVTVTGGVFLLVYLLALRARNWERGAGETRRGLLGARLRELDKGLRMKTLMRDPQAGLMHAMIYYAFIVLFLGTVTLEIDHILPESLQFLKGSVYQWYSAILDLAGLVFLGGLAWAGFRRYVQRPSRLRGKTRPEDGWILGILAAHRCHRPRHRGRPDQHRRATRLREVVVCRLPVELVAPSGRGGRNTPGAVDRTRRRVRRLPGAGAHHQAAPHVHLPRQHVPRAA